MYDHLKTSHIARNEEIEQLQKLSGQMQRQEAAIRQQKAPQAYTSAALWQGKKASNPRPTVLERESNLFLLGLLKSLIFLCSMDKYMHFHFRCQ
jgi:hypothetical protein